jgi:hypothetical protein
MLLLSYWHILRRLQPDWPKGWREFQMVSVCQPSEGWSVQDPRKSLKCPRQNVNVRIILAVLTPKMCGLGMSFDQHYVRTLAPASEIDEKIVKNHKKNPKIYILSCGTFWCNYSSSPSSWALDLLLINLRAKTRLLIQPFNFWNWE